MKHAKIWGLLCVAGALCVGCEKSVVEEEQDVMEAQQDAAENVRDEQADVREAAEEGAANIAEEEREADAARIDP